MKQLLLAITVFCGLNGLFAQTTINDPNAEPRDAKSFHSLRVSHAFDVYITQGDEEGLAVSASDKKNISNIKTEVKDGELRISYDDSKKKSSGKLKAYVSVKNIDRIHVSGASNVKIVGVLKADKLDVKLSGASDLKGQLEVAKFSADLNGASDMIVSGSATKATIEANGASNFKGFEFAVDVCDATAGGASDIQINVSKELTAKAAGASDIRYSGEGVIREMKTSGAASIAKAR
jgi:hypothetical protein